MQRFSLKVFFFTLVLLCVYIISPFQLDFIVKSQKPTPTPGDLEAVLGRLPDNCIPGPEPLIIWERVVPLVGGYPAWAAMSGPKASLVFLEGHPGHEQATEYGFARKLLWYMRDTYRGVVTITGENIATHEPVYFQLNTEETPAPVLHLQVINRIDFPSTIYIPSAGCYSLQAEWDGGLWRINFAAGEIGRIDWEATATAAAND